MATRISEEERAIWRDFVIMRRQLDLTLERRLQADVGISAPDYEILISLFTDPDQRMRAGQLGDLIGWEKSRVSHQLTRMQVRGLITRVECDDDGRGVWVELTDAGRAKTLAASGDRVAAVREYFFDVLTPDEIAMLSAISTRIIETINPPSCAEAREKAALSA
jgi:DNA-binding MarR family transcriptional regulator